MCKNKFENDMSNRFSLYDSKSFIDNHGIFRAELGISLDVIYHLTENEVYQKYTEHLFSSSEEYVISHSANTDEEHDTGDHVRDRKFTDWVKSNATGWELAERIDNEYSYDPSDPENTAWSDFYIFTNTNN
jgi:hypothetical protein